MILYETKFEAKTLAQIFRECDIEDARIPTRYPVRNHEPRAQMGGHKWHLIWERDGGVCWMCDRRISKGSGEGEVDHLIPRSSFLPHQMELADRSDNLRLACVACNQAKSNFDKPRLPNETFGVTDRCWWCVNCPYDGEKDPDQYGDWCRENYIPEMNEMVWCGRERWWNYVPDVTWLL